MQRQSWIPAVLDGIGAAGLIGAAVALGGASWFTEAMPEQLFFNAFHACLAAGVGAFALARVTTILAIVAGTPDPRRARIRALQSADAAAELVGEERRASKLQRAA